MELPRIDSRSVEVDAPPAIAWRALIDWMAGSSQVQLRTRFARLLGCEPLQTTGEPGAQGSTIPGFRVARSVPPHELALEGGHRFSDYSLRFDIEPRGGRSLCTATTHAAFPGLSGQLYKTAVIRSRAHHLLTKRLLDELARRAEDAKLSS
jgi:hypothetical protein